jgi:pimeloyl-ACP methyl ester carboxylesterase
MPARQPAPRADWRRTTRTRSYSPAVRVRFGVLLAVVGGTLSIGAVEASAGFELCRSDGDRACLSLTVPIDRSGAVPGTVRLRVERSKAKRPVRPPLFVVAGDPGQATNDVLNQQGGFVRSIGKERHSRDVISIDVRGTGRSGKLSCPSLDRPIADLTTAVAMCATRLGTRRAFYTAVDAADDIEAVREELGIPRIGLYGSAYGSVVVQTYARRHPTHVDRMVLDSVLPSGGEDPLARSAMAAAPRVLRAWCGRCGWAREVADDLSRLVRRLERRPATGLTTSLDGRRHRARIAAAGLWSILLAGDRSFHLRGAIPGAVRNALRGDYSPLLQTYRRARLTMSAYRDISAVSMGARAAAICEAGVFPWDLAATADARRGQAAEFVDAMPDGVFGPFDGSTALAGEFFDLCAAWPDSGRPRAAVGSAPAVPTLLVAGGLDLRTSIEGARAIAAEIPDSELLTIANGSADILRLGFSDCLIAAVGRFLAGGRGGRCPDGPNWVIAQRPPPLGLDGLAPAGGARGRAGRTVAAVMRTLAVGTFDVFVYGGLVSDGRRVFERGLRADALRGGNFVLRIGRRTSDLSLSIRRASYVPGVRIDGELRFGRLSKRGGLVLRRGHLVVRGSDAARGSITVRRGIATGFLGRHRVPVRFRVNRSFQFLVASRTSAEQAALTALRSLRP